jgi:hypothetical protein
MRISTRCGMDWMDPACWQGSTADAIFDICAVARQAIRRQAVDWQPTYTQCLVRLAARRSADNPGAVDALDVTQIWSTVLADEAVDDDLVARLFLHLTRRGGLPGLSVLHCSSGERPEQYVTAQVHQNSATGWIEHEGRDAPGWQRAKLTAWWRGHKPRVRPSYSVISGLLKPAHPAIPLSRIGGR